MKNRIQKAIPILLCAAMLLLLFGCGWDSTPTYVIATPTPEGTVNARWTESPAPDATPAPEQTQPNDSEAPDGTADAQATAEATPEITLAPGETVNPNVTPTPDPYLIGRWEFKRMRHKGQEQPASETNDVITLRLFDNGSAEMNIYKKSTTADPPQDTQGVQWRMSGSSLILTLYGETIMTLVYDGTYLTFEQEVFDDTFDIILEKVGV